jgi:hypothetical protein
LAKAQMPGKGDSLVVIITTAFFLLHNSIIFSGQRQVYSLLIKLFFMSQFRIITACLVVLFAASSCKKGSVQPDALVDDSANYTVSTFAGNGTNGNDPATGGLALLNNPTGIAFDTQGNLYVADTDNDKIRKISTAGVMTTLAGSTIGYADGNGSSAQFNRPISLTIDAQGTVYIAEAGNLRIRKITVTGDVTTLAGNGTAGTTDGNGTAAKIDIPGGLLVDGQGDLYFTQTNFYGIRKLSSSGMVSSFVGSTSTGYAEGTGTAARFNETYSMTKDGEGNIYLADRKNKAIRKVTPQGLVSTFIKRNNETEVGNMVRDPMGNFYVAQGDFDHSYIVKIDPAGKMSKIAGSEVGAANGPGNTAKFSYITGMAVSTSGELYVAELFNNVIRKIRKN